MPSSELFHQFLHQLGMLLSNVLPLPDIGLQVIEPWSGELLVADELVVAVPHGQFFLDPPVEVARLQRLFLRQMTQQADAIDGDSLGHLRPRGFGDRREQIRSHGGDVRDPPRPDPARPVGECRHPVSPFEARALLSPKGATGPASDRTVVGEEHDQRLLLQARFLDGFDHPTDVFVHDLDHLPVDLDVEAVLAPVPALPWSVLGRVVPALVGIVWSRLGQVDQERLVLVPLDEVDGVIGHQVGGIALLGGQPVLFPPVLATRLVDVDPVIDVPREEADELVEALVDRVVFLGITKMPLAEEGGSVALRFQHFGKGRLLRSEAGVTVVPRREHPADPAALLVATGQQRRTGRAADGAIGMEIGETNAARGQGIDVRGLESIVPEASEIPIPQVIRQNDDEVGTRQAGDIRLLVRACRKEQEEEEDGGQAPHLRPEHNRFCRSRCLSS